MGQGGQTQGLVLYENAALVRRLWREDLEMDEVMECSRGLSLSFEHEDIIPLSELEEAKARGWPLIDEDNCPSVLYKLPGSGLRQPNLAELELLEACLLALPKFYREVPQDDFGEHGQVAVLAGRDYPLKLRWLDWR